MPNRDNSVIEHIKGYCEEIEKELKEIDNDKEKFLNSSVYKNSLALCVLQIGELVSLFLNILSTLTYSSSSVILTISSPSSFIKMKSSRLSRLIR